MIKELNQTCEKLNHTLGVSVKLPNPKKKTLKAAVVCNFIVGAGLVTAGIVLRIKSCALLSGVSILAASGRQRGLVLQSYHDSCTGV